MHVFTRTCITAAFVSTTHLMGACSPETVSGNGQDTDDKARLTATLIQADAQADPSRVFPIAFDLVFSTPVDATSLSAGNIEQEGTAPDVEWRLTNSGDDLAYALEAISASGPGTIRPNLNTDGIVSRDGAAAEPASGADREVSYDNVGPIAVISVSGGLAPGALVGAAPVAFDITFDEAIAASTLTASDFAQTGTASGVLWSVAAGASDTQFTVEATSVGTDGSVVPRLAVLSVEDLAGNSNLAAVSGPAIIFDTTAPTVAINQSLGQLDPINALPILFDVTFSEPIVATSFEASDVIDGGTSGAVTWTVLNSGDNMHFAISATAVASFGTLKPSLPADAVNDAVGHGNAASNSSDNEVEYSENHAPVAVDDVLFMSQGSSATVRVLDNDTDIDPGTILTVASTADGMDGTTSIFDGTLIRFVPNPGFAGRTTFTYEASDGRGGIDTATVVVTVVSPFTWTGAAANNNWSNGDNWCGVVSGGAGSCPGGTPPTSADVAYFNDSCTRCDIDIDVSVDVQGVVLGASYSGTLIQLIGQRMTIGGDGWTQWGGSFVGGNKVISVGGEFNFSGGNFTSTTDSLTIAPPARDTGEYALFSVSPDAVFDANGGTVVFNPANNYRQNPIFHYFAEQGMHFHNLTLLESGNGSGICTIDSSSGLKPIIDGTLTHDGPVLSGRWDVQGHFAIGTRRAWGSGIIEMASAGTQQYSSQGGRSVRMQVNKTAGTVEPIGGTDLHLLALDLVAGTFVGPAGTLTLSLAANDNIDHDLLTVAAAAAYTHNSGTLQLRPENGYQDYPKFNVDLTGAVDFYSVVLDEGGDGNGVCTITTAPGDNPQVLGTMSHIGGTVTGQWDLFGNFEIGSRVNSGSGVFEFKAAVDQEYKSQGGRSTYLRVNKPSGQVIPELFTFDFNVRGLDIVAGTFVGPAGTFELDPRADDNNRHPMFSISSPGSFLHNNGLVYFNPENGYQDYPTFTVVADTAIDFNNVEIAESGDGNGRCSISGEGSSLPSVVGILTHNDAPILGEWLLYGDLIIKATAPGGGGVVRFVSTDNQQYGNELLPGGKASRIEVDKLGGTLTASSSGFSTSSLSLINGTFDAPTGDLEIGWNPGGSSQENLFIVFAGTSFVHNSGRTLLRPGNSYNQNPDFKVLFFEPVIFNNFKVDERNATNGTPTITSKGSPNAPFVEGTFEHTAANMDGKWQLAGDVAIGDSSVAGAATFELVGAVAQTITQGTGSGPWSLVINKTGGTVASLQSAVTVSGSTSTVVVVDGELDLNGQALTAGSAIAIQAAGTLRVSGGSHTPDATSGAFINDGTYVP